MGVHGKHNHERIQEGVEALSAIGVSVFFIMHSSAEDTSPGLRALRECTDLPIGAYAHAIGRIGSGQPAETKWTDLSPADHLEYARGWVDIGAQIIGGCCGIRPGHIQALKAGLPAGSLHEALGCPTGAACTLATTSVHNRRTKRTSHGDGCRKLPWSR